MSDLKPKERERCKAIVSRRVPFRFSTRDLKEQCKRWATCPDGYCKQHAIRQHDS